MSQALALQEARRLQKIVQRYGVKCTIELKVGRPWSGDDWYSKKTVLMNHHTAGPSSGLTPSYKVCRDGRPGVPGPLCNGYGGRDKVFRIVCMGLANHPGEGGPLTVEGVRLPKDSARISSFGIEWEHNGVSDWPDDMLEFMGRVGAAVLEWMGRPIGASIEHKTWAPDRKIDRNDFSVSGSTGQALIKKYAGSTVPVPPKPPVPDTEEDVTVILSRYGSSQYVRIDLDWPYVEVLSQGTYNSHAKIPGVKVASPPLTNAQINQCISLQGYRERRMAYVLWSQTTIARGGEHIPVIQELANILTEVREIAATQAVDPWTYKGKGETQDAYAKLRGLERSMAEVLKALPVEVPEVPDLGDIQIRRLTEAEMAEVATAELPIEVPHASEVMPPGLSYEPDEDDDSTDGQG